MNLRLALVFNVALITVININSKTWKKSHRETAIRVAEVPQGRPREESEFRCVYVLSLLPLTKFLKNDRMKRKRKAIGTVYAFSRAAQCYICHILLSCVYLYYKYLHTCACVYIHIYTCT